MFHDAGVENVLVQSLSPDRWTSYGEEEVRETLARIPDLQTKYGVEAIKSYKVILRAARGGEDTRRCEVPSLLSYAG